MNSTNPSSLTKKDSLIRKHLDDKFLVTYIGTRLISDIIDTQKHIQAK